MAGAKLAIRGGELAKFEIRGGELVLNAETSGVLIGELAIIALVGELRQPLDTLGEGE